MGHSYITGEGLDFQVRDLTCESILKDLLEELAKSERDKSAMELAAHWLDYWHSMPPGCRELALKFPTEEDREVMSKALAVIIPKLDPEE